MASSKNYKLAIQIAGKVNNSFNQSIGAAQGKMTTLGNVAAKAAQIAAAAWGAVKIGQFIGDAVNNYKDFEKAMDASAVTARASNEEYAQMEAAARAAGAATTKTATEAAEALGYMALAGWDVQKSTAGLMPILRLSEATNLDLARASDLVTDSMSALGIGEADGIKGVQDMTDYLNLAVQAQRASNTSAEALMEALIGCGGAAKSIGVDMGDLSTALGILANNGTKGAEAGTALNSMLMRMTSKDVAIKQMKALGVSVYDAQGNFRGLETVLGDVQKSLSGLSTEDKMAAMAKIAGTNYSTEMSYLLASMASTGAEAEEYLRAAGLEGDALTEALANTSSAWEPLEKDIMNHSGVLDEVAKANTDNLPGAIELFKSAVSEAQLAIVKEFAPYAKDAIKGVADAIPGITAAITPMITGFIGFALPKIQKFGEGVKTVFSAFQSGGLAGGMESLGGFASELMTGAATAASSMLTNIGGYLKDNLPSLMDIGLDFVMGLSASLRENAGRMVDGAISLAKNLAQGLADSIPTIVQHVPTIISNIAGIINDNAPKLLAAAANIIWTLAKGLVQAIPTIVQNIPKIIGAIWDVFTAFNWMNLGKTIITGLTNGLKALAGNVSTVAKTIAQNFKIFISDLPGNMLAIGKDILRGLWNGITGAIGWLIGNVKNFFLSIISAVKALFGINSPSTVFADIGKNLILGLFNGISGLWSMVTSFFTGALSGLQSFFSNAWANILGAFNSFQSSLAQSFPVLATIIQGPIDTIKIILEGLKGVLDGIIQFITGVFTGNWSQAWEGVKSIFGNIFNSLAALVKQPINAVISIINKAISGINGLKLDIPDWVPVLGGKTFGLNIPEIPQLAVGGIVTAPTVLEAGEGGEPEAILPLSKLAGIMRDTIASMNRPSIISDLLGQLTGAQEDQELAPVGGPPIQIHYNPQYHFEGEAPKKEEIVEAEKMSQEEFARCMARWRRDNDRKKF